MSVEFRFEGAAPLKDGVTLVDLVNLWFEDEEEPLLVLPGDPDQWYELDDLGLRIQVADGLMSYDFYGVSWVQQEQCERFIKDVAERFARAGWVGTEGEDDPMDVIYGPTERAKARRASPTTNPN